MTLSSEERAILRFLICFAAIIVAAIPLTILEHGQTRGFLAGLIMGGLASLLGTHVLGGE